MRTSRAVGSARAHGAARTGNTYKPTTLEVYTERYETALSGVSAPVRQELTNRTMYDAESFRRIEKLFREFCGKDVRKMYDTESSRRIEYLFERYRGKDAVKMEKEMDDILTAPVRARLNAQELAWLDLPTESKEKLERRNQGPKSTMDLAYMELPFCDRVELARKGMFAPPAQSDLAKAVSGNFPMPSVAEVANVVGSGVAAFASGILDVARSAGAVMQPAPAARYGEVPSSRYLEAPTTRYLETPSAYDSRVASSRAPSTRGPTSRYDTGYPSSRHSGQSLAPSRAPSQTQRVPSRHETKTVAPTRAHSKMTGSRAETRTKTENKTSRHHGTEKQATEYTNLHISLPGHSKVRR